MVCNINGFSCCLSAGTTMVVCENQIFSYTQVCDHIITFAAIWKVRNLFLQSTTVTCNHNIIFYIVLSSRQNAAAHGAHKRFKVSLPAICVDGHVKRNHNEPDISAAFVEAKSAYILFLVTTVPLFMAMSNIGRMVKNR